MQKLVGGEGENDMCRAAHKVGINYILSSSSTTLLEEVIQAPPRNGIGSDPQFWFQIYIFQAREKTKSLIQRVEKAGYKALVVTVDAPVLGNRINERKTPLVLPDNMSVVNLPDPKNASNKAAGPSKNRQLMNAQTAAEAHEIAKSAYGSLHDASLTWQELIPWLRKTTTLKIILKGIMTAEDARLAVQSGVDGIVVSNHGGRQLDGVSSTLEALPEIVDVVQRKVPVIVDGGIRRGSDILKALALGANLCLIGRTALWGLGYNRQEGVELVLNILERELTRTMALVGAKSIKDISRDMLGVPRSCGFGIAKL
jgi:(S)-2-hydroxy-acid oxidase